MRDAVTRLVAEIQRLRVLRPIPIDRESVIAHLRSEVDEVEAEPEGSEEARHEAADVLGIAIHLCFIEGVDPHHALEMTIRKLSARLNLVESGLTWKESKEMIP